MCNSQKKVINGQMAKHTIKYYSTIRRNRLIHSTQMNLNENVLSEKKKPIPKHYIQYYSTYITLQKRQNYRYKGQISGYPELGDGGDRCGYKKVALCFNLDTPY